MPAERGRPKKALEGQLPEPPEYRWTLTEIAVFHRLTSSALKAAIARGELKAEQCGKEYRVSDSDYREWIRCQRVPAAARSQGEPPADKGSGRRHSFFSEEGKAA